MITFATLIVLVISANKK
ncbi:hypothetical protein [uncultured Megasphaera sp.]